MTPPGALAVTGIALLVGALACALISDERSYGQSYSGFAWILLAMALGAFIGSAWWEALS